MPYQRREEGYASLGAYIDGANSQAVRFAHSQPVVMCYEPDGDKVMQMYLGPTRTAGSSGPGAAPETTSVTDMASLPAPTDPRVRLNVAGGEVVAVMHLPAYITPTSAEAARQRLMDCLRKDCIALSAADAAGRFRCAQYGAVYQLGERLNEMMLQVRI